MIPNHINYVPTLAIRSSEMNALEYLPGATKNNLKPCVLLAPWGVSKHLNNSIKRFEEAYSKEPYFLDIDKDYDVKKSERPAINEMNALKVLENGYENWINFIKDYPNVHPCIQYEGQDTNQIKQQIKAVKDLKRPYCLRIDVQKIPKNIDAVITAFAKETDYTVILEGGWVPDILTLTAKFSGFISTHLNVLNQSIPIVISYTSFPKGFVTISGIQPAIFENRQLVSQMHKYSTNRIIYGDWGSARPRDNRSGGGREPIPARIDYPTKEAWYIARNKEAGWNYQIAADQIVKSNVWQGALGIWGEDMIERTAQNQNLGIFSPQKNTAARINIHLHLQAFYDAPDLNAIDLDDDFED